jgi:hypothetical protein
MVVNVDIIIPAFKSKDSTLLCLRSFLKFNNHFNFNYFVVENSNDESYKKEALSLSDNVTWVQNPTSEKSSFANANALHRGIRESGSEFVFVCHNDVLAVHKDWVKVLFDKIVREDYCVAGFRKDNTRIGAIHISGLLTTRSMVTDIDLYPVGGGSILDVGDSLTKYCIDNGLKFFSCRNTHNNPKIEQELDFPFSGLHDVDRALSDDNEVLFLHLGRGTQKTHKTYYKPNKVTIEEWVDFGENFLKT